jgi:tol-pal system-associated acyl-CoA thioesterase
MPVGEQHAASVSNESFRIPVRVYYEDTDAGGMVYHATYLRFLERARTDWLRVLGFHHQRLASEFGVQFVVQSLQIKYLKPAWLDDLLEATARIDGLGGCRLIFRQTIERDGETITHAGVSAACLELGSAKPVAMPLALRNCLQALGART